MLTEIERPIETQTPVKNTSLRKTTPHRQLVIFINLSNVINSKIGIFLDHAKNKAQRLELRCSALMITADANNDFTIHDVKDASPSMFQGHAKGDEIVHRDECIFKANMQTAEKFINFVERVHGYYEHILIIGEMVRSEINRTEQYNISGISDLEKLAQHVLSLSNRYAATEVWQRVQICKSGVVRIKSMNTTFAEAVIPKKGIVYASAPRNWSLPGTNGSAIDLQVSDDVFFKIVPFIHKAVLNEWYYDRMQTELSLIIEAMQKPEAGIKKHFKYDTTHDLKKEFSIASLDLKFIYAKKTYEKQHTIPYNNSFFSQEPPAEKKSLSPIPFKIKF